MDIVTPTQSLMTNERPLLKMEIHLPLPLTPLILYKIGPHMAKL